MLRNLCLYSLAILILLIADLGSTVAQFGGRYQYRYQPPGRYYPNQPYGYRPGYGPNAGPYRYGGNRAPAYSRGSGAAPPKTNVDGLSQPPINVASVGEAKSVDRLKRMNFQNPSLDLLRQLGQLTPRADQKTYQPFPRLAGEFEPQRAVLLSISDLMYQHHGVLREIIQKTSQQLALVILVNDRAQLATAVEIAESAKVNLDHVSFYVMPLDTIWLRDFGPRFIELGQSTSPQAGSVDFLYDGTRPKDDKFPDSWGRVSGNPNREISWTLQGGNLISNGDGLAITSTRIFEDNLIQFPNPLPGMNVEYERRKIVVENFKQECNIDQMVFLHPVAPEATKHVDMFATFLAKDHILVADVDPRVDPYNARVLNENARLLRSIEVDGKPLRVDRIRIPARNGKFWSPYTNVIFANQLLLMPIYDTDPKATVRNAIETYQRLLPGVNVQTINMTSMQKLEGALHCMSVNVPSFASLPAEALNYETARRAIGKQVTVRPTPQLDANSQAGQLAKPTTAPSLPGAQPERRVAPAAASVKRQLPSDRVAQPVAGRGRAMGGPPISGSAQTNSAKTNSAKTNSAKTSSAKTSSAGGDAQRAAAMTYRRKFVDASGKQSLDGVAIGISTAHVYLLRASDRTIVRVELGRLCQEDRTWLRRNVGKIQANGSKVQAYFLRHPF